MFHACKSVKLKCSLSFRLKVSTDCKSLTDCGRTFHNTADAIDSKTAVFFCFFVFFSKSVKKSVKHSLRVLRARSARASHVLRACGVWRVCLSPVSLSVYSFVQGLLFDFSRVLEYAKIRTVLQSDLLTPRQTTDHRRT